MKLVNIKFFIIIAIGFFFLGGIHPAYSFDPQAIKNYNEGVDFSKKSDFQDAIVSFRKAIAFDPTFVDAYYNLGSIYEYLGDKTSAVGAFQELLRNNPNDEEAAYRISSIYYKSGEYNRALNYTYLVPSTSSKYTDSQVLYKNILQKINKIEKTKVIAKKPHVAVPSKILLKGFQGPTGIAKDSQGNVYVANYSANSIVKITPDGQRKLIAKDKLITGPIGLVIDLHDNIYVANYGLNDVVKITPDGKITTFLKGINKPYYLFLDKAGMLYISEQGTNSVIKTKI